MTEYLVVSDCGTNVVGFYDDVIVAFKKAQDAAIGQNVEMKVFRIEPLITFMTCGGFYGDGQVSAEELMQALNNG